MMSVTTRTRPSSTVRAAGRGFTLVELLVVMSIVALLLSIAAPKYFASIDKAKEVALRSNLRLLRDCIDKFHADRGEWPTSLDALVTFRYLRAVPEDPIVEDMQAWVLLGHPDGVTPGIYDVHSSAPGVARDGTAFASW